eukprot:m.257756 g.257756  ORF g.257756 m.257756 type:complete len:607 (-) comp15534_c4_seq1:174-1994(-)
MRVSNTFTLTLVVTAVLVCYDQGVAAKNGGHGQQVESKRFTTMDFNRTAYDRLMPHHLRSPPTGLNSSNYITEVHDLEMGDGVHLHTIVFIPIGVNKKYGAVLMRTPYNAKGLKGEGEYYIKEGFVAVMQDFRGRYASFGTFQCWFDAASDGKTTIDWIKKQSWSNGAVFSHGVSANGIAAYLEEMDVPQPGTLRAQYVIVATAEFHRTIYQGGAYRHSLYHGWLDELGEEAFEQNITSHEALSAYYDPVSMTNKWNRVTAPAVHLSGWYDIFNAQQLDAYYGYQTQSAIGKGLNFLFVAPTGHCVGGQVPWPNGADGIATSLAVALTLFKGLDESGLTEVAMAEKLRGIPAVNWYVMGPGTPGSKGNYWTSGQDFPSPTPTSLYLTQLGNLTSVPPAPGQLSFDYNPLNPVPTLGGNNLLLPKCGPWDQSVLEQRDDVLSFTSQPLTSEIAITGDMQAVIYLSSNCTDTDVTVKILDVYPNGTAMMVQDGIARVRWNNDSTTPHLMTPGQIYAVKVDVWSTSYIFNTNHSIRVDVSSSNFPRFNANPNTGDAIYTNTTVNVARNTIHMGTTVASKIILPVVSLDDLPPVDMTALKRKVDALRNTL